MMKLEEAWELAVLVNSLAIDSKCTMHVSNRQFLAILGELIHFLILSNNAKICCLMDVSL